MHQWAGLQVSLLLLVVLATGTFATVSPEIDWLLHPAMRVEPRTAPTASWGRWLDAARRAAPDTRVETLDLPVTSAFTAEAVVVDDGGERRRVQIDPWSARATGVTPWLGARRLLRDLHRHLMLPGWIGLPVVAILSLPLTAVLVTSFAIYKKWWRGFLRLPRRPRNFADRRRFVGDLHRWVGLWTLPFLALIALTGGWYLTEWAGLEQPDPTPSATVAPTMIDGTRLDRVIAAAMRRVPAVRIRHVAFPDDGGILLAGQSDSWLVRDRANAVLVDGVGASVASIRGDMLSPGQRIAEAADPLHFGDWGGTASRWLWFILGLSLTTLAATGVLVFAMRSAREEGSDLAIGRMAWRGMGYAAIPVVMVMGSAGHGLVAALT